MFKFVAVYRRVDEPEVLDDFFAQTHLPLAEQLPELVKSEVSRVHGKPGGESRFYLMYELYFATEDAFWRALASAQGGALLEALKPWGDARILTWFYGESWEEEARATGDQDG